MALKIKASKLDEEVQLVGCDPMEAFKSH